MARILETEDDWNNAQMLLQLGFGITRLPAECAGTCSLCGYEGWCWDVGDKSICLDCGAKRSML